MYSELDYSFHDYGYIVISPSVNATMGVTVGYTSGSTTVTSDRKFNADMVGMYIYIGGEWREITDFTDVSHITVENALPQTGTTATNIVRMNHITVDATGTLTKLEMTCAPRVR